MGVGSVWLSDVMDERLSRHDLTDEQWALLAPLMPPHPRQGHRWTDHQLVIDGVFHGRGQAHGTFEPSGDDRNAGENPSQGRDAGAPGEASDR